MLFSWQFRESQHLFSLNFLCYLSIWTKSRVLINSITIHLLWHSCIKVRYVNLWWSWIWVIGNQLIYISSTWFSWWNWLILETHMHLFLTKRCHHVTLIINCLSHGVNVMCILWWSHALSHIGILLRTLESINPLLPLHIEIHLLDVSVIWEAWLGP